ncbi:hypothetical protein CYMTET_55481 [Cymbomonas tetramitiformis]|uniref:Uncharacterized protein n=1 Tax=Cymbomonas tetramitiformis TaxID=36881 RepID=A0AAE0ENJ5_9CHLO|nr:hypothetical protein CYMTET_55481 [Cymbomonas tetramitiformis]
MKADARDTIYRTEEWRHSEGKLPPGKAMPICMVAHQRLSVHIQSRHPHACQGRWKWKATVDFPDGFFIRYNGPAAEYKIYGRKEWPTPEETAAILEHAERTKAGTPLVEGETFELFKKAVGDDSGAGAVAWSKETLPDSDNADDTGTTDTPVEYEYENDVSEFDDLVADDPEEQAEARRLKRRGFVQHN